MRLLLKYVRTKAPQGATIDRVFEWLGNCLQNSYTRVRVLPLSQRTDSLVVKRLQRRHRSIFFALAVSPCNSTAGRGFDSRFVLKI